MSAPSSPRLACRIVRLCASTFGLDPARHAASCEACREYFQGCADLDAELRREAVHARSQVSPSLERDIMRAVLASRAESDREAVRPPRRSRLGVPFFACATIAAVALGFVLLRDRPGRGSADPLAFQPQEVQQMIDDASRFSARIVDSIGPLTETVLTENPLRQEVDLVVADARNALDFLALNFLPGGLTQEAAPQPSGRI